MSRATRVSPLFQMPGRPVAYFPAMTPACGSVKATILLCQLVYWTPRSKDDQGWIYKSRLELMQETGLSLKELRGARAELVARGLVEERYERLDHQLWVRVNVEAVNAAISLILNQEPKGHMAIIPKGPSEATKRAHDEEPIGPVANMSSEIPESTAEMGNVLMHKEEVQDTLTEPHVSAAEHHADVLRPVPDWETQWKRRYDQEILRPLTRPPDSQAPAPAPVPDQPEPAVHLLIKSLATKATMPAEDVEARRAFLRAQSAALIAQGY